MSDSENELDKSDGDSEPVSPAKKKQLKQDKLLREKLSDSDDFEVLKPR